MSQPRQDPELLKLVNDSGFLLQLRLQQEIAGGRRQHGWEVIAAEHHWRHPQTAATGYIDLIVGHSRRVRFVIECKRPKGGSWVFLTPRESAETGRVRCFWTDRVASGRDLSAWDDYRIDPLSRQAGFCVVAGQDKKEPMLERLAGSLLESVEALAYEELQIGRPKHDSAPEWRIYVPLIITTAELAVCEFDPGVIDLDTGTLLAAEFQSVPWVRFHKGLAEPLQHETTAQHLKDANLEKERTVLVIKASELSNLLASFEIHPWAARWPPLVARELAGPSPTPP